MGRNGGVVAKWVYDVDSFLWKSLVVINYNERFSLDSDFAFAFNLNFISFIILSIKIYLIISFFATKKHNSSRSTNNSKHEEVRGK